MNEDKVLVVPAWVLYLMIGFWGMFAVTFIPWSCFITGTVYSHESQLVFIHSHESRLDIIEKNVADHGSMLNVLKATALTTDNEKKISSDISSRLERMESKIDTTRDEVISMRKEIDLIKK